MSGSFSIPPEYKDFVSDSADLLRQFSTKDEEDRISFKIYFNKSMVNNNNISNPDESLSIYQDISRFLFKQIENYIWHFESPTIQVVYPDSFYQNPTTSPIRTEEIYIFGSCRVGNNIEDEWYITYILLLVSKEFPEHMIYVYDSDDQFLLVEAAEALPAWLGPENAENRTWIKNGLIHIISIEEGGIDKYGVLKLSHALSIMRNTVVPSTSVGYINSNFHPAIQDIVNKRTLEVYPAKLKAINHKSIVIMPRVVANLLVAFPQLVTPAVHALGDVASAGCHQDKALKHTISELTYFKPYLNDMVAISVHHTRALHSQLTYHSVPSPKCMHPRHLVTLGRVGADAKVKSSLDLGTRIVCGFEAMYYLSHRESSDCSSSSSSRCRSSNIGANMNEINTDKKLSSLPAYTIRSSIVPTAHKPHDDSFSSTPNATTTSGSNTNTNTSTSSSSEIVYNIVQNHEPWNRLPVSHVLESFLSNTSTANTNAIQKNCIIELDDLVKNRVDVYDQYDDSSAWLYMTPEEFEKDMTDTIRRHRYTTVFPPSVDPNVPTTDDTGFVSTSKSADTFEPISNVRSEQDKDEEIKKKEKDEEPLQSIVDKMNSFMVSESDFDGISDQKAKLPARSTAQGSDSTSSLLLTRILSTSSSSSGVVSLDKIDWSAVDLLVSQAGAVDFATLDINGNNSTTEKANPGTTANSSSESFYAQYFSDDDDSDDDSDSDSDGDSIEEDSGEKIEKNIGPVKQQKDISVATKSSSSEYSTVNTSSVGTPAVAVRVAHCTIPDILEDENQAVDDDIKSSGSSVDSDDEVPENSCEDSTRRQTHSFDMDALLHDSDDDDDDDNDDEEDEEDEEEFMEAYMSAMETELKGNSSLFQAFEQYSASTSVGGREGEIQSDGEAVDVEANLLKHLLESHASAVDLQQQRGQRWTSGPASVLLAQLGISLPTSLARESSPSELIPES